MIEKAKKKSLSESKNKRRELVIKVVDGKKID